MSFDTPYQDLSHLEAAIHSLVKLHPRVADEQFMAQQDEIIRYGLEAGLIQNFEFTYELCWKAIKRWLEENISPTIADGVPRRELFRMAAENLLIEDVEEWMRYHRARNDTSHRYGVEMAQQVLVVTADFGRAAQRLLQQLKARHG